MLDCLIIGAGPTGLTLACELLKRNMRVRIVDQLEKPTKESRALAIQSRTLELFEKMGLINPLFKKGQILQHAQVYYEKKPFVSIDFKKLNAPYPLVLVIPQSETEAVLTSHLTECGGFVERGKKLFSLKGSTAVLRDVNGPEERVEARWIFGCDGAHSTVRHALDIPFEGAALPETFALADVEIETDLPHTAVSSFIENEKLCVFFPLPRKNWFRMIVQNPEIGTKKELRLADFQECADRASPLPVKLLGSEWISAFSIQRRIASTMRVGRTFLLGDAAHIHSPVGGQGLNTSIQDAFNLAWKIALVHHEQADESLLDSFEKERLPIAKKVLEKTTLATHFLTSPGWKKILLPLLRPFASSAFVQRKLLLALSEIGIAYPSGRRAPDAPLSYAGRLFQRLHPTKHTLLLFGDDPSLVEEISSKYPEVVDILHLDLKKEPQAAKIYRAKNCCYLIRPDGYIAFAAKAPALTRTLHYLRSLFK